MRDLVSEGLRLVLSRPVSRTPDLSVLGCLQKELGPKSVDELMEELRGPVEATPADSSRKSRK